MNKKGFTLIELLVVVLIISILAAVALPKYQTAVMKSRYVQLKILANKIADAQDVYYLANGKYANRFEDLAVDTPAFDSETTDTSGATRYFSWGSCDIADNTSEYGARLACRNPTMGVSYYYWLPYSTTGPAGKRRCRANNQNLNSLQNKLCKAETGATPISDSAGTYYWDY